LIAKGIAKRIGKLTEQAIARLISFLVSAQIQGRYTQAEALGKLTSSF
jgi:hypothetical protein